MQTIKFVVTKIEKHPTQHYSRRRFVLVTAQSRLDKDVIVFTHSRKEQGDVYIGQEIEVTPVLGKVC